MVRLAQDERAPFHGFFLRHDTKTNLRRHEAEAAIVWLRVMKRLGKRGAILFDIDDTIIDGNECVRYGFEDMKELFTFASRHFPVYIVTARPDDQHGYVMSMLQKRGFSIPTDRMHMLPSEEYGRSSTYVEKFKMDSYRKIFNEQRGVLARFGDKLWDAAHIDALRTTLSHVGDSHTYRFMDPRMPGTYSCKLPGNG